VAKDEQDREDLLTEAKALTERVRLEIPGHVEPVIVGFRPDGSASFYFGAQPAYHFTSSGKLRRAFVDDFLYKAERGQLVSLRRDRTPEAVNLLRHVLDAAQLQAFIDCAKQHLQALHAALTASKFTVTGQVPADGNLIERVERWLDEFANTFEIAARPHAL
jgi:hypothetical protein